MTTLEILEAHDDLYFNNQNNKFYCDCGLELGAKRKAYYVMDSTHRAHVAEVLNKHMQEREAAVIAGLAELLDEYRSSRDIAECAAPVEGETGRQAVIDNWEMICEEPAEWLREQSNLHHENGFEHLRYVAYEAWQAGFEAGWDEAKDPDAFVNDVWDAKTPNPYRKDTSNGR